MTWRARFFIARDFLAFEAPRRLRVARRPFRAELARWFSPACAIARLALSAPAQEPFA